jgi:signal transduction histidine kinase/putative methionine-R-sulfoxide reductase with GAF domain
MGNMADGCVPLADLSTSAEDIQRLRKELRLREDLSHAIISFGDPDGLLENVLRILMNGFQAEGGAIYFKEKDSDSITVRSVQGIAQEYLHRFRKIEMGTHVTGMVAQSGKPLLVKDSSSDMRTTHDVVKMLAYRSAMATPVLSEDKVVGVIALIHPEPFQFDEADLRLLASVGAHLSPAIVNSFLNKEIDLERRKISEILESAEEGIFEAVIDRPIKRDDNITNTVKRFLDESRFTLVNSAFEMQCGTGALLGRSVKEGFSPSSIDRFIRRAFRKGKMDDTEKWQTDDRTSQYETSMIVVINEEGEIKGIRGTRRDITQRIEMQESLKRSKRNTELYLDLLLHDISNINTVSSGFLELMMLRKDLSERSGTYLTYCLESVRRATQLINKVRTLSHIESENQGLQRFDLVSLFDQTIDGLRKEYKDKELTVHKTTSMPRAEMMSGDLIKDMLLHLLVNSIVHNANRSVEIWYDLAQATYQGIDGYMICISDNGPGIPDIMKEKVFDRSLRQDGNLPGSGLGLPIVKGIIERYSGQIWVEDRVRGSHGMGSCFRVFLPKE